MLDTEQKSLRFSPGDYPEFVRAIFTPERANRLAEKVRGNYASVKITEEAHLAQAQEILEEYSLGFTLSLEKNRMGQDSDRPRVRIGMSQNKILKRWIQHHELEDFTGRSLLKTGLSLIKEAEAQ
jgi:hypothetical protein